MDISLIHQFHNGERREWNPSSDPRWSTSRLLFPCINEPDECEQIYAIPILLEMNLDMCVSLEMVCLE